VYTRQKAQLENMAALASVDGEIELILSLVATSYDPFQLDLEWFEYELAVVARPPGIPQGETREAFREALGEVPAVERRSVRGRFNRQDFAELLRSLDDLLEHAQPLRFEPYDLNFYLEWTLETPHVYLVVSWFDLAITPRRAEHRFPSAHAGFRFPTDRDSLARFRRALQEEFLPSDDRPRKSSSFVH